MKHVIHSIRVKSFYSQFSFYSTQKAFVVLTWSSICALPYHTCRGKYLKNIGTVSCNQPISQLFYCDHVTNSQLPYSR